MNITCTSKSREDRDYSSMLEILHASSLQYRFPSWLHLHCSAKFLRENIIFLAWILHHKLCLKEECMSITSGLIGYNNGLNMLI